jgi:prophage regulatory protein
VDSSKSTQLATTQPVTHYSDKDLSARYRVSRNTIWRWAKIGDMPKPVKLGPNCTRWEFSTIQDWEAEKFGGIV